MNRTKPRNRVRRAEGHDVADGEVHIPLVLAPDGVGQLVLVKIHDRRHVSHGGIGQPAKLSDIRHGRRECHVPLQGGGQPDAVRECECRRRMTHPPFLVMAGQRINGPSMATPRDPPFEKRPM